MLDGLMRRLIDPPLGKAGERLARARISPDLLTGLGLACGFAAAAAIGFRADAAALVLLLASLTQSALLERLPFGPSGR